MAHRQQPLIDRILDQDQGGGDHSLRKKALDRATGKQVPTTMTPWEWQEWYAQHGVPDSHQQVSAVKRPWWRRLFGRG